MEVQPAGLSPAWRREARRIFEETLRQMQAQYVPEEDLVVDAQATTAQGDVIVVARYQVCTDGRIVCLAVLDEDLWPDVATSAALRRQADGRVNE